VALLVSIEARGRAPHELSTPLGAIAIAAREMERFAAERVGSAAPRRSLQRKLSKYPPRL